MFILIFMLVEVTMNINLIIFTNRAIPIVNLWLSHVKNNYVIYLVVMKFCIENLKHLPFNF